MLRGWRWPVLLAVFLVGFFLRVHSVGDIFLWLDETEFFNAAVYGDHPTPLVEFVLDRKQRTTNTIGWPAVVWVSSRAFGRTVKAARAPSVVVGTAAILAIFFLIRRIARNNTWGDPFIPAIFAALLTAICIVQMEFSQRTYAYGATPFFSAMILLAHFEVWSLLRATQRSLPKLSLATAFYSLVCAVSLFINPTLAIAAGISFLVLIAIFGLEFFRTHGEERLALLGNSTVMGLVLFLAALVNAKNPIYGFRPYMLSYYHPPDLGALSFLVKHAYDLLAYHLNLFYNGALYWPLKPNLVLLPLIAICFLGWAWAAAGRLGAAARHLALLGALAIAAPAMLSLHNNFPFGGVRQSLFLTPYVLGFTALGFYAFRFARWTRATGVVIAGVYMTLWGINVSHFYQDRVLPFTAQELVRAWQLNERSPICTTGGSVDSIRYWLRDYPEITINNTCASNLPPAPFLVVSPYWDLQHDQWHTQLLEKLAISGNAVSLLIERPAKYMASWEHPTTLYFPPNGLWVYKVTKADSGASPK